MTFLPIVASNNGSAGASLLSLFDEVDLIEAFTFVGPL